MYGYVCVCGGGGGGVDFTAWSCSVFRHQILFFGSLGVCSMVRMTSQHSLRVFSALLSQRKGSFVATSASERTPCVCVNRWNVPFLCQQE